MEASKTAEEKKPEGPKPEHTTPNIEILKSLLNRKLRVTITDGRILTGLLHSLYDH
jgi:hypothetical protein